MSESDPELKSLLAKRMAEMKNNMQQSTKPEPKEKSKSPREIVVEKLGYRGLEVLANAEAQRPQETAVVIAKLADLIKSGELQITINGGDLLGLFRAIGINIRMQTKISVENDGKLVSLSDKLAESKKTSD